MSLSALFALISVAGAAVSGMFMWEAIDSFLAYRRERRGPSHRPDEAAGSGRPGGHTPAPSRPEQSPEGES